MSQRNATHEEEAPDALLPYNPGFFNMQVDEAAYYSDQMAMFSGDFYFPTNVPSYLQGGYCMKGGVGASRPPPSGVHDDGVRFILETSQPTITTDEFMRRHSLPEIQLASGHASPLPTSDGFPGGQLERRASKKITNRAAAVRCRVRKASWVKDTRDKLERDRDANAALQKSIVELQQEIFKIHRILSTASVHCPSTFRPRNKLPQDPPGLE